MAAGGSLEAVGETGVEESTEEAEDVDEILLDGELLLEDEVVGVARRVGA